MAIKPLFAPTGSSTPKPSLPKSPLNHHERRRCYKCQGFRHIASDFPNRKVITLVECKVLKEAEWEEEGNEKEVQLMVDEEECVEVVVKVELLVLRKDLSGKKAPNDEE